MTKVRWVGLVLVLVGILVGVLVTQSLVRDGPGAYMGRSRFQALVFVPFAVVTGLAFLIGDVWTYAAFRARPKSRAQLTFVFSIIAVSGVLSGFAFWQLKTRVLRPTEPVILEAPHRPPSIPTIPSPPSVPSPR